MGRSSGNACEYIDLTAKSTSARSSFLLGILGPEPRLTASFSQTPPFLSLHRRSAYTYSRSIEDVSTAPAAFDARFNHQTIPRGPYDFDRGHRFVTPGVYQLPFFSS